MMKQALLCLFLITAATSCSSLWDGDSDNKNEMVLIPTADFLMGGIDDKETYKWEKAIKSDILSVDLIRRLTECKNERNKFVHSTKIDKKELMFAIEKAKSVFIELTNIVGGLEEERNI